MSVEIGAITNFISFYDTIATDGRNDVCTCTGIERIARSIARKRTIVESLGDTSFSVEIGSVTLFSRIYCSVSTWINRNNTTIAIYTIWRRIFTD